MARRALIDRPRNRPGAGNCWAESYISWSVLLNLPSAWPGWRGIPVVSSARSLSLEWIRAERSERKQGGSGRTDRWKAFDRRSGKLTKTQEKTKAKKSDDRNVRFTRKGRKIAIRSEGERVEIEIDGTVHEVRFLDNGRPYTRAYVNAMATDVRNLAERFVDFTEAQEAHWAELRKPERADG